MNIAKETEGLNIICLSLRTAGDRYLKQKEYKKALDLYLNAIKLAVDALGDAREAYSAYTRTAVCLAYLGNQFGADKMLSEAETYAKLLGDTQLIEAVSFNRDFIWRIVFLGKSSTTNLNTELIESAKRQLDDSGVRELEELFELMRFEKYKLCLDKIGRLLSKHNHADVQACLVWIKSNIYHRTQKVNEEIGYLKNSTNLKKNHIH